MLYEKFLAGEKWQFVATLDEAWIHLSDSKRERKICYVKRDGSSIERWYRQARESFPKGFMVVAGFAYNGNFRYARYLPRPKLIQFIIKMKNCTQFFTVIFLPFMVMMPKRYGSIRTRPQATRRAQLLPIWRNSRGPPKSMLSHLNIFL